MSHQPFHDLGFDLESFHIVEKEQAAIPAMQSNADWAPTYWLEYPPPDNFSILSAPWARPAQQTYSFVGVNVVDVEDSTIMKNMTVKTKGGKIESISKSVKGDFQHGDMHTQVVNASGLYLCPGLIDMHSHITAIPAVSNLKEGYTKGQTDLTLKAAFVMKTMLARGFTTIRDVGGANKAYADATESWLIPGPRLFQGGPVMSQTGGHGDSANPLDPISCCQITPTTGDKLSAVVDGVDACMKMARKLMMQGADHIKICSSGGVASLTDKLTSTQFTVPEIKAICDTVRMMGGTLVTAHCFTTEGARNAIEAGIGGIEHGALIDEPTLKLMAEKGVFLTPTVAICEILSKPPFYSFIPPTSQVKLEMVRTEFYEMIKKAYKCGVTMVYGTDMMGSMWPFQLYEFDLRAKILPAPEILKHATCNSAKALGKEGLLGVIAPGAYADILFLSANPLEDVTILNKPNEYLKAIMKDGRFVSSKIPDVVAEVSLQ